MKRRVVHSQLDAFGESVIVPSAVGRRLLLLFILSAAEILKILRPAPNHAKLYTRTVEGCIPVKRILIWERSR